MIKTNSEKLKSAQAAAMRRQRDTLLAGCDWAMVSDAPTDKNAWTVYRQALRDISNQDNFPENIIWPTPPAQ